jgi:hypothetical protein
MRVASNSLAWPTQISAFEDESKHAQSEWLQLKLGSALPIRLYRKRGKGAPRKFDEGSPNAFALEYCMALLEVKLLCASPNETEIEKMKTDLNTIRKETLPKIKKKEAHGGQDIFGKLLALENQWRLAAALLDDFPPAAMYRSDVILREWLNVAMMRAESICYQKWEDYPYWPPCVIDRVRKVGKSGKKRTTREAVSECLRRGMENLRR